jgi:SOS-response transcriptional repressor LexA/DNA-binding Xre family transcriptional regulator
MDYIDRIKLLKSEKKITNDMLSEMTGIPLGTLSKILAGISDSPKLSNIVAICDALGTSLEYVVNGIPENTNNFTLDRGEMRIIENYRALDTHGKELVTLVLDKEKERVARAPYVDHSVETKEKSGKILPSISVPDSKISAREIMQNRGLGKRSLALFDMPVSAGAGVFVDSPASDEIMIPDNERTREADFALRISGNSMEPKYRDGDVLLVANSDYVEVGELGIFILDGNGFFKIYGGDRLISMNKIYGDILLKDFEAVSCVGRVIGKLKRK